MRRIRIAQLITELHPAGAERVVYELARRLDRERFEVGVIALRGGEVAGWLARAGLPVEVLDICCRVDAPSFARLVRLLRRWRVDILHTHLFHADLVGRPAAWLAGVRHLVHTVHVAEARFRPWQYAFARMTAGACEKIVCVSESVKDHHRRRAGLPDARYRVIHNGVDASAYACDIAARRRLRQRWSLPDDRPLLAFVGRLDAQKGVNVLLGALSHLGARGDAVDIVVAGDGPQRDLVETYVRFGEGGSRCRHLGYVGDVRSVLSAADVLVLPSLWEGFGLAAAEAMAAGLPVIASDVPGLREVVSPGETGLLVPPGDVAALAMAIEQLVTRPPLREKLGEAGRVRVIDRFSLDSSIRAHERLYAEVSRVADPIL